MYISPANGNLLLGNPTTGAFEEASIVLGVHCSVSGSLVILYFGFFVGSIDGLLAVDVGGLGAVRRGIGALRVMGQFADDWDHDPTAQYTAISHHVVRSPKAVPSPLAPGYHLPMGSHSFSVTTILRLKRCRDRYGGSQDLGGAVVVSGDLVFDLVPCALCL
jgi:hypothetical protein